MKKAGFKIAAALDIGPESVNLKIAQAKEGEEIETLESLSQPVALGEESFSGGPVSYDTAEAVADSLNNYYNLAKEYQVPIEYVSAVATTALRNASNKNYVTDQINVKTSREITIIEDSEEKSLIFREMLRRYGKAKKPEKNYLMVYTGTGSVGVAAVQESYIVYSQNVKTDTLKLTKMTEDIKSLTMSDFSKVIDEYLNYICVPIKRNLKSLEINAIVASGEEIDLIEGLCSKEEPDKKEGLKKEALTAIYDDVSGKSSNHLKETFGLPFEKCKKLLIVMAFYIKLMDISGAKKIVNVGANITDALLYSLLFKKEARAIKKEFDLNMVASARFMAEKFSHDKKHSAAVERFALTIFDNLKKVHGFSRRERLYLQTAAILHDIGKYVDSTDYDLATVHLIMDSFLISLNTAQKAIIANIARYHGNETPAAGHSPFSALSDSQKMIVSKLSAILRLADALDYSRTQKIKSIGLNLYEKKLSIIAEGREDTTLEEWTFNNQSVFFEQVFGIKCDFVKKGMI
jgi:exopolyphosphatase/guanosine-5'-triphosphate,3'-diphosphate pyrophosphatase